MKHFLIVLVGLMASVATSAAGQGATVSSATGTSSSSASATSTAAVPRLQQRNPRYRLSKSDSFDIDFAFSPELNQAVAVQPDGYVTLKEVGSIYVCLLYTSQIPRDRQK